MVIDSKIPVLEPATSKRSPNTVINPITIPPSIAAVGIISFNFPIKDYYS